MAENILIIIQERRAQVVGSPVIVCGNSDYTIAFDFDSDWNLTGPKTARFVYVKGGKVQHEDKVFSGDTVNVPVLSDVSFVDVGVFAGDLCTTTPARIRCKKSILCGSGEVHEPTPDVYAQIMALFNEMAEQGAFGATEEQAQQIEANKQNIEKLTNGTQQVGDSAKLGGKDASEYVTTGDDTNRNGWNDLSEGFDLNNAFGKYRAYAWSVLNSLVNTPPELSPYGAIEVEYIPIAGTYYGIQILRELDGTNTNVYVRSVNANAWGGWKQIATIADLANYFKNTGGTVTGDMKLQKSGEEAINSYMQNAVRLVYQTIGASGAYYLYDGTNNGYIIYSTKDGTNTFNGTASGNLPLSGGGKIQKSGYDVIELENTAYYNSFVVFRGTNGRNGAIGFLNVNRPAIMNDKQDTAYDLHHDGNSAKVAIQETAPTDGLWVW